MERKEIGSILLAILVIAIAISAFRGLDKFMISLIFSAVIIFTNVLAKKVASYYLDSKIEFKLWEVGRYWFKPKDHFKKPIPLGMILSLIIGLISLGYLKFLAVLEFDVKPATHRVAKRFELYSFSEMTEWHIGLIAFWGIVANLAMAFITYFIGFPELAKLNIYLAVYSIIPVSNLDGTKIIFGSKILYTITLVVTLIALSYALWI